MPKIEVLGIGKPSLRSVEDQGFASALSATAAVRPHLSIKYGAPLRRKKKVGLKAAFIHPMLESILEIENSAIEVRLTNVVSKDTVGYRKELRVMNTSIRLDLERA